MATSTSKTSTAKKPAAPRKATGGTKGQATAAKPAQTPADPAVGQPAAKSRARGKAAPALVVRVAKLWTRVYDGDVRVARVATGSALEDGKVHAKNVRFDDGSWIVAGREAEVRAALDAAKIQA